MDDRADILIVDDSPADRRIALRAFERSDLSARVAVARDGEEALAFLRDAADSSRGGDGALPRVVFLDLRMPRVDGYDVLRAMRADVRLRDVPVVVVSTSRRERDVGESYRLGANSYVAKRVEDARPGDYLVRAARYWLELNEPPA